MNPTQGKRLQVKRETLRELSPTDIALAQGAASGTSGVSNCCCEPTSNQGGNGCYPKI